MKDKRPPPPSNRNARIESRMRGRSSARRRRLFPGDPGISKRISWLLEVTGLSTREADRLAGTTEGHAHALARGAILDPRVTTIAAFARVFNVDPGWIISGPTRLADPTPESANTAVSLARTRLTSPEIDGEETAASRRVA